MSCSMKNAYLPHAFRSEAMSATTASSLGVNIAHFYSCTATGRLPSIFESLPNRQKLEKVCPPLFPQKVASRVTAIGKSSGKQCLSAGSGFSYCGFVYTLHKTFSASTVYGFAFFSSKWNASNDDI